MAEWLQYMTSDKPTALTAERARNGHPGPWKIAYFAVGNETWGCGGNMTPDHYVDLFRQYATFLKAPARRAPHDHRERRPRRGHLMDRGARSRKAGPTSAPSSFHYYTLPGDTGTQGPRHRVWRGSMDLDAGAHAEDGGLHRAQCGDHGQVRSRRRKWPSPSTNGAPGTIRKPGREPGFLYQQNTLRDAVVAALNLNIFHQHADRVRMANIAQMVNVLQAMILTQGPKMILTPTYHVFHMFRPFQDATFLPTELQTPRYELGSVSVPAVEPSAARTAAAASSSHWSTSIPAKPCRFP